MKKFRILGVMILLALLIGSVSFGEDTSTYTVMIYMNGSDLESSYDILTRSFSGSATADMIEMSSGHTQQGAVNVIVQTGGTANWANDYVDPSLTQRFELIDGVFTEVDALPAQNIGYKKTLTDFIVWTHKNYPADKYALVMWNHGGGPVGGYGLDELSNYDSLMLEELDSALATAKDRTGMTFELIGFDACLMASIEVADIIKDYAKYLVASEEIEPSHGWNYDVILKTLNASPSMDGASLGKTIAASYLLHAKENGTDSDITLSVIDLSKIENVVLALENLIAEADTALADNLFFYEFARSALAAKSFGGNTEVQGYTDLIDINSFAYGLSAYQDENATALIQAVENAVITKADGKFTFDTSGLSIYFPYRDRAYYAENMATYARTGFSPVYQDFLKRFKETLDYHEAMGPIEYEIYEPNENSDYFELILSQDDFEKIYYVYIDIYTTPLFEGEAGYDIQYLGYDFLVTCDEENHAYFEDFRYLWTYLDSEPLMTFITQDYDDLAIYESPVVYNGEEMNLLFAWVVEETPEGIDTSHYEIYGLRRMINPQTGMPDKNLYQLEAGAVIQPIYLMQNSQTGESIYQAGNEILVTDSTELFFNELPSDEFLLNFRMTDFAFNHLLTDFTYFTR